MCLLSFSIPTLSESTLPLPLPLPLPEKLFLRNNSPSPLKNSIAPSSDRHRSTTFKLRSVRSTTFKLRSALSHNLHAPIQAPSSDPHRSTTFKLRSVRSTTFKLRSTPFHNLHAPIRSVPQPPRSDPSSELRSAPFHNLQAPIRPFHNLQAPIRSVPKQYENKKMTSIVVEEQEQEEGSEGESETGFVDLDQDTLLNVLERVDAVTLGRAACVNKLWRKVTMDNRLWEPIGLRLFAGSGGIESLDKLGNYTRNLEGGFRGAVYRWIEVCRGKYIFKIPSDFNSIDPKVFSKRIRPWVQK